MFRAQWPVPDAWRAELYTIGGQPNQQAAYLDLWWNAGETHEPVQRWVVLELLPQAALERTPRYKAQAHDLLAALRGPPPVTMRSWVVRGGKRVLRSTAKVAQWQWEIYRRTGCYALPHWIIQGSHGGHLWQFLPAYQLLLRTAGRPLNPPLVGDLPYAPWDNRVVHQLTRERELREQLEALTQREPTRRTERDHKREYLEIERMGRRALLAWLDTQLGHAAETTQGFFKARADDLPLRADREVTDEQLEAASAAIVNTTETNPEDL